MIKFWIGEFMSQGPIQTDGTVRVVQGGTLFSRCVDRRNTENSPDMGCGIIMAVTLYFSKGKERSKGRQRDLHLRYTARDEGRGKMEGLCLCVLFPIIIYSLLPGVLTG